MTDQAEKLRTLVHTAEPAARAAGGAAPMVVVSGGRAGVGTTTVALNLAAVLTDQGERVLLVDGAQQRNEAIESASTRRDVAYSLCDVLAGKCSIREAIVAGPAGIQLLPNRWNPRSSPDFSRRAQQRLLTELEALDGEISLIVMDAGRGASPWTQRLWDGAELVLLVTTPDDAALLDAYAALKLSLANMANVPIRLLVNRSDSDAQAADAHRRMNNACQKFLSCSIPALPALPRHMQVLVGTQATPRVWEMPNTPFGHAALWLGRAVGELVTGDTQVSQAVTDEFVVAMAG